MENTDKKLFYVYVLLDPTKPGVFEYGFGCNTLRFNYAPFYIGKGCGNRIKASTYIRKKDHSNPHKKATLQAIKAKGLSVITLKLIETTDEELVYAVEEEAISIVGRILSNNGPLTNISTGGDGGTSGVRRPPEVIARIRAAQAGVPRGPMDPETKLKISASSVGRTLSEQHKQRIGARHKGKIITQEARDKISEAHTGKLITSTHALFTKVSAYKYRYTIIGPDLTEYVTYTLKYFAQEHGLDDTCLLRSHDRNTGHKGYRLVAKERLPKGWLYSQYYVEYLDLGGVDVRVDRRYDAA